MLPSLFAVDVSFVAVSTVVLGFVIAVGTDDVIADTFAAVAVDGVAVVAAVVAVFAVVAAVVATLASVAVLAAVVAHVAAKLEDIRP